MSPGRVAVVGLGPAGADLLVPAARTAWTGAAARFVRTARHPAVGDLEELGLPYTSFDAVYESLAELDDVYRAIAAEVGAAAARVGATGEVVYAVPGSPAVAEHTVALLRAAADRGEIGLRIVPGLSFTDLAWSRLGVDPLGGGRVVDGHAFTVEAADVSGPILVAQCDSPFVLGAVKLALLEVLDPAHPVTVLRRLGLPGEAVGAVALADLDRDVVPDHLTSLYVDTGGARIGAEFARLVELADRLRDPGGCPWDAEQTHHSLSRYLLEEAYEVVEAVERLPAEAPAGDVDAEAYAALEDELGDLLYQVVFHARLGREAGAFTVADVCTGIHDKLVRRHPHVFGEAAADTSADVMRNWEQIKKVEKGTDSMVTGITPGLPSLLYMHKLLRKAGSVGVERGDARAALSGAAGALVELESAPAERTEALLGEALAHLVAFARARGVDAESSLRAFAGRYRDRFERMERAAAAAGVDLPGAPPEAVRAWWAAAADGPAPHVGRPGAVAEVGP